MNQEKLGGELYFLKLYAKPTTSTYGKGSEYRTNEQISRSKARK